MAKKPNNQIKQLVMMNRQTLKKKPILVSITSLDGLLRTEPRRIASTCSNSSDFHGFTSPPLSSPSEPISRKTIQELSRSRSSPDSRCQVSYWGGGKNCWISTNGQICQSGGGRLRQCFDKDSFVRGGS